ncbi:MAG TPA: NRDE family protein [Polyangia bacterium]|nr:NRDE family protein [Polyangia bacterium]
MAWYGPFMCLLIALFRQRADAPLVVAANRDEQLARPAMAMTVLREAGPRLLGGRDLLAGGTWMAVGEHGVVAALTNVPAPGGRDASKRSRGELPLALALHATAAEAAAAAERDIDPAEYNPCWLLVGDRASLFYLDLGAGRPLRAQALPPGVHVLENQPLAPVSIKAAFVADAVSSALPPTTAPASTLIAPLHGVLRSHDVPPRALASVTGARPLPTFAACVHGGTVYGTRSAAIVLVPSAAAHPPAVFFTDGPPCTAPLRDAAPLWTSSG